MSDVSVELKNALNCMEKYLPPNVGRISSISDEAGLNKCRDDYEKPPCSHLENSCHYGGGTFNQSYAVDIGDEENYSYIKQTADSCTQYVSYEINEGNHIHISTVSCPRN